MSRPYFSQVPDFLYVNRTPGSKTINDFSQVKNLFKRGKLREDIYSDLSYFTKYKIIGNERPDNVAEKIYDDPTLDWVILLSNNMINIQTEWPMSENSYRNFLIDKYGNDENIGATHHYECTGSNPACYPNAPLCDPRFRRLSSRHRLTEDITNRTNAKFT